MALLPGPRGIRRLPPLGSGLGRPSPFHPGSSRTRDHRSQPEPLEAEGISTSGGENNERARARRQLPVSPGARSPRQQGSGTRAAPGGWPAPGPSGRLGSVLSSFGEQCGSVPAGGVAGGGGRGWTLSSGSGGHGRPSQRRLSSQWPEVGAGTPVAQSVRVRYSQGECASAGDSEIASSSFTLPQCFPQDLDFYFLRY